MDELQRRALARLPLSADEIRFTYTLARRSETWKTVCESHERLRAELDGTATLLRDAEAEVLRLRGLIERDRSGLAAGLAKVRRIVAGWDWLGCPGEWGCYDHTQKTVATLRDEIGRCLAEIETTAIDALRASGSLVSEAFHGPNPSDQKEIG